MKQKWNSKLLSYDMLVEYERGPKNSATDALCRREESGEQRVEATSF